MNTKSGKSMSTFAILLALFCVAYAKAPLAEVAEVTPFAEENYRLPLTVMPESYKIWLQPFLRDADGPQLQFTFKGDCEIVIVPQETTNQIKLHTKRLAHTVTEYWLSTAPLAKQRLTIVDNNDITNIITFQTEMPLTAGTKYTLHFVYTGIMEDDMHGFYKSSYKDKNNNTKWLGSTQFQSYHSRRAFPCFDEPKFKATFQLTLVRHRSMKTVSNTRLTKSEVYAENREWIVDVYEPTPVMSAYIVAFIFSEFNERFDGQFGVLARPEYYDQTEYAHEVGIRLLDYLDKYYDLPYYTLGNDKMHMAAIPDFSAGAMENWGLLTYRERGLLYDPESTTLSSQQYIAAVISHEQTHMWFGDLVTCDWWSYTWLNEGFARYFQYFATAAVEKQFHIDQQFTVDQIQSVMNMDSTNNTNPMSDENTNTPSDLGRMFNSVSYNKGATFLRQIKHIITEEKFQQALREYLKANQYKSTIPSTLFTVFKKYWPTEFAQWADDYFKHFTEQPGYPLITIDMTKVNNGRGFEISQKRFLLKENDGSNASLIYTVPFTYTTDLEKDFADTKPKLFLQKDPIVHNHPTNFSWVVANIQQVGYYRVNYDNASWHNIHHALLSENWGGIHEINRAQIADDVLNLARASIIDYELAFDVLEFLETETHYLPWTAAFNGMNYLAIRLGKDTEDFGRYILRSTEKAYSLLGFEEKVNDTSLDIYARAKVLTWACKFGNGDCIWKAKEHFSKMHQTPVPVNVRAPVYCTALREGTEADFDHMFQMYKTSTVATDQVLYLNAMGCVKDEKLVEKYFNIIISDDVRIQDMSAALAALYSENNENVTPMWKLVTTHFEKLAAAFGGDNEPDFGAVASVISNIASRFTEKEQETELKTFNAANKSKFGSAAATLERAEKNVAENLEWAGRKLEGIRTYLSARSGGSATANAFTALSLVLVAVVAMLLK